VAASSVVLEAAARVLHTLKAIGSGGDHPLDPHLLQDRAIWEVCLDMITRVKMTLPIWMI
jgi:hypothetical protein